MTVESEVALVTTQSQLLVISSVIQPIRDYQLLISKPIHCTHSSSATRL